MKKSDLLRLVAVAVLMGDLLYGPSEAQEPQEAVSASQESVEEIEEEEESTDEEQVLLSTDAG